MQQVSTPRYGSQLPILQVPGSQGGLAFESSQLPPGVEPTHMLVGTGSYYVPIPIESARAAFILAIMSIVILILLVIAWAFSEQRQAPTIKVKPKIRIGRRPRAFNSESRVGEAKRLGFTSPLDGTALQDQNSCDSHPNAQWDTKFGVCKCLSPWWGPRCQRESVEEGMTAFGVWDPSLGSLEEIGTFETSNLSFGPQDSQDLSCSQLCTSDSRCKAVLWKRQESSGVPISKGLCTLLSEVRISGSGNLSFDPQQEPNLYLRGTDNLIFEDRVFIYGGRKAYRWWLTPNLNLPSGRSFKKQLVVEVNQLGQLSFFPLGIRGATELTGLYGLQPWTLERFQQIVQETTQPSTSSTNAQYYVHVPGSNLEVPLSWYASTIWVMYSNLQTSSNSSNK